MTVLDRAGVRERLAVLVQDAGCTGAELRRALTGLYDGWLVDLLGDPGPGVALVAVGSLGRREPAPGSDLDLLLVHDGWPDVPAVADRVWYPVWDSGTGLDHSVRTVAQAVEVARGDLSAALGLLEARHVAGDRALSAALVTAVRGAWRAGARTRVPELGERVRERARTAGEVAFLLEPDLKQARGGLRDVAALRALAAAQLADVPGPPVEAAAALLLDVRGELHRRGVRAGGRGRDVLLLQEQDAVAAALGRSDADALMGEVSEAARTVAYASDTTWRRVRQAPPRRVPWLSRRRAGHSARPVRRPLADDVVEQGGEVVLARDAEPERDPVLPLRVARAAAQEDLPVAPATLTRLAERCPPLPDPWPRAAREELVGLLAAGPPAVAVLESLDQAGLLVALLPEWRRVRSRPQRNSLHRFTVDRHSVETAAGAAALTRRVDRPDLLLLGALFHDIGKGGTGDHCETGAVLADGIGRRLGLPQADVEVLVTLVRLHLLLPEVATRRDLDDPATVAAVARTVGSRPVLELLHALTEADAAAAGPAAWSTWKAGLVAQLVARTAALLDGAPPPPVAPLCAEQDRLAREGGPALQASGDEVTVVAPDRPGLLAVAAGVLALHRLDVLQASASSRGGTAVAVLRVRPRFGQLPDWSVVRRDLLRGLDGELPLGPLLRSREGAYARRSVAASPPTVRLVDDASARATVVEVRAPDGLGVLHRIAAALAASDLDVRTAHISTLGSDVVDSFYVTGPDGRPLVDPDARARVVHDVLDALAEPVEGAGSRAAPV